MVFLPIAQRELRVNARKRGVIWTRASGALIALAVIATLYGLEGVTRSFGRGNLGSIFFTVLTWLTLAAALSAGLFLTSDSLSEEKREGTLGLLFLTDLRGYDVAVGKFMSAALQGFYGLLAILPIIAVTFLLGGVTGAAFWKSALALLNALFVSLAAGLFASTISRDSLKALAFTLFLLTTCVGAGPILDAILAQSENRAFQPMFSITSPGYAFAAAGSAGPTLYWGTLLVTQALGWILFAASCGLLGRSWQDRPRAASLGLSRKWMIKAGGPRQGDPLLWLTSRERWQAIAAFAIAFLLLAGVAITFETGPNKGPWFLWSYVSSAISMLLYLGVASLAVRALADARRTGFLELLLATPLTARDIVGGKWRGFVRVLGLPMLLLVLGHGVSTFMVQAETARSMAAATAAAGGGATNTVTTGTTAGGVAVVAAGGAGPNWLVLAGTSFLAALTHITSIVALIWFGMWMGLTGRKGNVAILKTIVFVQVVPWFFITIASWALVPWVLMPQFASFSGSMFQWYPVVSMFIGTTLYLSKDAFFVLWARRRLYSQFRERVAGLAPVKKAMSPNTMVTTVIPDWGPKPGSGG